jgi:hypothetical protein
MLDRRATIALSILTGIALELAIHAMTGRREAWDSSQYWSVGLPIAGVVALLLGYLAGGRRWIWTLLIVPAQVTTMMLRNGEIGTLWPLMMPRVCSQPAVCRRGLGRRLAALAQRRPSVLTGSGTQKRDDRFACLRDPSGAEPFDLTLYLPEIERRRPAQEPPDLTAEPLLLNVACIRKERSDRTLRGSVLRKKVLVQITGEHAPQFGEVLHRSQSG